MTDLADFLPATLELASTAAVIAAVLGGLLGIATAKGKGTAPRLLMLAGASAPPFLLALAFLMLFYSRWHLLPSSGRLSPASRRRPVRTGLLVIDGLVHARFDVVSDALWHLVLPALCLALGPAVAPRPNPSVVAADGPHAGPHPHRPGKGTHGAHGPDAPRLRSALNAPLTMGGLQVGMLPSPASSSSSPSLPGRVSACTPCNRSHRPTSPPSPA